MLFKPQILRRQLRHLQLMLTSKPQFPRPRHTRWVQQQQTCQMRFLSQARLTGVLPAATQRRTRPPSELGAPVLVQAEPFPFGHGHKGCCSILQSTSVWRQMLTTPLWIRAVSTASRATTCARSAEIGHLCVYKRRFPHLVSLHEPAGRNQLAAQCTSLARSMLAVALYIAACGNPLTDDTSSTIEEVFAADFFRPAVRRCVSVRICKACRYSSERNKHLFPCIVV